jgi:hypothetical protein
VVLLFVLIAALTSPAVAQTAPTELRGDAILAHPAGKLVLKAAELLAAGRTDDVIRLRSREDQAEWKKEPAAEREAMSARMKQRAPDPAALAAAIREGGVMTVWPGRALLEAPYRGDGVMAMFTLEGTEWRMTTGPMIMEGPPSSTPETRLRGVEIEKHGVYDVALRYADALHTGPGESFMALASTKAQAEWKAAPASERAESTAFRKKNVPKRAALVSGIRSGGILIVQGDTASLNVTAVEQGRAAPGTVTASSTTVNIPFVLESGTWKLAR